MHSLRQTGPAHGRFFAQLLTGTHGLGPAGQNRQIGTACGIVIPVKNRPTLTTLPTLSRRLLPHALFYLFLSVWTVGPITPVHAQFFKERTTGIFVTAMPTWMYNGFTKTEDGDSVQGSDVSPLRMALGAGADLTLSSTTSLEPELWFFLQEYIALKEYNKTVPTQIETGSVVGDIAQTLGVGLSVPWVYTWKHAWADRWSFDGKAGLSFVFRIPLSGVDGTDAGPVGGYWIAGRFLYPQLGLGGNYQLTDTLQVGAGLDWYIPIYNLWDDDEPTPFLDETMLRWGLRVRWAVGTGATASESTGASAGTGE